MSGPTLRCDTGAVEQEFLLRHGRQVIGRGHDLDVDLHLEADLVGPRHAELRWHDGILTITDLDSTAGTKVNGESVSQSTILLDGDILGIGSAELLVEITPEVWMDEAVDGPGPDDAPVDAVSSNGSGPTSRTGSGGTGGERDRDDHGDQTSGDQASGGQSSGDQANGVATNGVPTDGSWITGGVVTTPASSPTRPPTVAAAPTGLGRVLIIRHHRDGALASRLHRLLDRAGWDPWLVDAEILGGAEWANQTIDGLDDSVASVVALTSRSSHSEWVEQQVAQSVRAGVPLLAVVAPGAQPSEIMAIDLGSAPRIEVDSATEPDLSEVDDALRRLALGPLARRSITSRQLGLGLVAGGAIGALLALIILAIGGRPTTAESASTETSPETSTETSTEASAPAELSVTPASVVDESAADGQEGSGVEETVETGDLLASDQQLSEPESSEQAVAEDIAEVATGDDADGMTPTGSLIGSAGFPILAASVVAAAVGQALRRGIFSSRQSTG